MRPTTRPRTVTSSAKISPRISAFSPITRLTLRTSPSTRPSICMSPAQVMVPVMTASALRIEGAEPRAGLRAGAGVTAATALIRLGAGLVSLGLLENMATCLYETARVADFFVVPDFVMDMRAGAAAGGAYPSDVGPLRHPHARAHCDPRKVTISCMDAQPMVDFHHVAVGALVSGEKHNARRRGGNLGAPGTGEIDARMKGVAAGKGIDAGAEAAGTIEAGIADRQHQRDVLHSGGQGIKFGQHGGGAQIGLGELGIRNTLQAHLVERDFRSAFSGG